MRDAAIVAALLHDIGKLVLAYKMPDRFARLLARAQAEEKPLYQVEEELWGITHAEVGAYLLGLWGLPLRVTEAIAYHHAPSAVPHQRFDALAAVYVANLLAHESEGTARGAPTGISQFLEAWERSPAFPVGKTWPSSWLWRSRNRPACRPAEAKRTYNFQFSRADDEESSLKVLISSGEGLLEKKLTRWGYEVRGGCRWPRGPGACSPGQTTPSWPS